MNKTFTRFLFSLWMLCAIGHFTSIYTDHQRAEKMAIAEIFQVNSIIDRTENALQEIVISIPTTETKQDVSKCVDIIKDATVLIELLKQEPTLAMGYKQSLVNIITGWIMYVGLLGWLVMFWNSVAAPKNADQEK